MTTDFDLDTDHMVVVPHTPREDALRRGYYARSTTPLSTASLASEQAAANLATNTDLDEHAATWTRLWGR